jgi:hypothetical protein
VFQREQLVDGVPLREHYEQYRKSTGRRHEEDVRPVMPAGVEWYWRAYLDMARSRPAGNGFAPGRLGVGDVGGWARCQALELLPWEFELFMQLEAEWHIVTAEHRKNTNNNG